MKKRKIFAVVMAAVMTLSMVACGEKQTSNDVTPTTAPTTAPTEAPADPTPTTAPAPQNVTIADASITFEDGNMGFIDVYSSHARSAKCELSLVDYNGSKAVKVVNTTGSSKCPFVAIDASSFLGADVAKVAGVEMVIGTSNGSGKFYSVSGEIGSWWGEAADKNTLGTWSVYMEKKNPKVVSAKVPAGNELVADAFNIIYIGMTTDNASEAGVCSEFYIDDIRFFDAAGNTLKGDTTVAFNWPDLSGPDRSYLYDVANAVEFPGFTTKGGAWAQDGFEVPQEIWDALVPGSVVEVEFSSGDGQIWPVMPDAAAGWIRVAQFKAYINGSQTTAQIPYEAFVELCGEDKTTWGARMQFEGSSDWEVYSVKVGTASKRMTVANTVEFPDFVKNAGAWAQDGLEVPQEIWDALVPGSVVEIDYASEDGALWIVMPDAAAGWMRCGQGTAICTGSKCYVTYEQIEEMCGTDKTTWGARMQCEGSSAWEVYGVRVGTKLEYPVLGGFVDFPDFVKSAGAWAQDGLEMPQAIIDALVPGAVVEISYASEDGDIWIVMPDAAAGWMRCAQGAALKDNGKAYITYEQIAAACGEDKSTWGARMQCEGSSAWEVYGVRIGQGPVASGAAPEKVKPADPTIQVADGEVVHTGSLTFADSAWWTQNDLQLADLVGDVDPTTITAIKFYSDTNFVVGYSDTLANDWAQFDSASEYVVKTMLFDKPEGESVCIICLSKGDGVEYTINWEVYTGGSTEIIVPEEPAEPVIDPTTDTIEGSVIHTGSITFADSAWWTQNEMKYADIFGDIDPATVAGIKFYSDTNFVLGYNDTASGAWAQYDSAAQYVVKTMDTASAIAEDKSVCIICLSKGDGVEYTINWEVYAKPADPLTDTIEGTAAFTSSLTFADSAWWTQKDLFQADLIGDLDPATVAGIKFTSDTNFILGFTNLEGGAWYQQEGSSFVAKTIDFNKEAGQPVVCLYLSKGDGVEYTINWEVYTEGAAADTPVAADLVINFVDLADGGYGYVPTINGDAVDVAIASQYQEIQYILPEAVVLADYTSLIVDVTSNAPLDIKLVNSDAVLNEYSQKTPFLDNYTAEGQAITGPITIDLTPYADKDLSQINFMAMGNDTNFTIKSITFVK